jgi:hypothetical protein
MNSRMEVWDSSRIPKMVVRQASPTVKPVEARLTLSCRCIYVIFFGPKGRFVMNKYLYYWTWNLVIILLLYVWFEHPGHTYGGFVPSFSEWGMTISNMWKASSLTLGILKSLYPRANLDVANEGFAVTCTEDKADMLVEDSAMMVTRVIEMLPDDMS